MCQSSNNPCCQDYSLQTANTNIASVSVANNNLDGSGNVASVYTAALLGSIVKSVTIKATGPVTRGMVRFYIRSGNTTVLYKEVQIPVSPKQDNTPIPAPVLPMFETLLVGDIKLQSGYQLLASTQVGDTFNIIVEGIDWDYPAQLPTDCCNFKQIEAVTGVGVANVANPNTDGSGTIVPIFTSPLNSNGAYIKNVTIKAMGSTRINGMIRIFISPDGISYTLMREVQIPETEQSAYEPSFKNIIELNYCLQSTYTLGVATENADSFAISVEGEEWSYPI